MPMMQISTPATKGPSAHTLEFIKRFARLYQPQVQRGKYLITATVPLKPLGEC